MHDAADVGLVNAHPKGVRGHHHRGAALLAALVHAALLHAALPSALVHAEEGALRCLARRGAHARVVPG